MQTGSSGDDSKSDTPVPIPNTEVKPLNADGTWLVTTRESRKLPDRRFSSAIIFIGSAYRLWSVSCSLFTCVFLGSSMVEQPAVNR